MGIIFSPQDYTLSINDCEKISITICGRNYSFWCRKDKIETINYIIDKLSSTIESTLLKHKDTQFEKIIIISMIEYLSKTNETKYKINNEKTTLNNSTIDNESIINSAEYIDLKNKYNDTLKELQKEHQLRIKNNKQNKAIFERLLKIMESIKDHLNLQKDRDCNNK